MPPPADKNLQIMLLVAVALNVIPHTLAMPPWVTVAAVSFLLWSALRIQRNWSLPPKSLRAFLTFAGCAAVFVQWKTILGQEPATALLVYLATLKLLESANYRDAMLVIFTSYFLLMAHLLSSQSLASTLYMAFDVLVVTTLMYQVHRRDRRSSIRAFRPAFKLLAISLPVWIFLFLMFPRFSAGFFRLKVQPSNGTGFSDRINPGDIASLADSEVVAFRATFRGSVRPAMDDMYWRGAMLHFAGQGLRWSRDNEVLPDRISEKAAKGRDVYIQEIVLEPNFRKWLFGLDVPRSLDFDDPVKQRLIRRRAGLIFESDSEIGQRVLYRVASRRTAPTQILGSQERRIFLQTPQDITPDVEDLAKTLKKGTEGSTSLAVERVLRWFDEENFSYTKSPGILRTGQLREFLFESKRGFCEHYAAAFATIMRLMNIPARVIIGFHGGKLNRYGDYVMVRNLDAHAWAEVWSDERQRWDRVDPTSAVAPLRLSLGGDFNLLEPSLRQMSPELLKAGIGESRLSRLHAKAMMVWDATAMRWTNFLLRYDFSYQQEIFGQLGLGGANRMIFFTWVAVGIVLFIIVLQFFLRRQAKREDVVLASYHRYCSRLEKAGLTRLPGEGPLDFLDRAVRFCPRQADEIRAITEDFVALRYGPGAAGEAPSVPEFFHGPPPPRPPAADFPERFKRLRLQAKTFRIRPISKVP